MHSMTGFGKAELKTKFGIFAVEIKTLNHKFLEVTPRLANSLSTFDDKVKALIKHKIKRGKVYFNLSHDVTEESAGHVFIDEALARNYSNKLKKLGKRLKLEGSVRLQDIISFPGVISFKAGFKAVSRMWPSIRTVVNIALDDLVKDRQKEGAFLLRDLTRRIKSIREIVTDIKKNARHNVRNYKKRLSEKIKELTGGRSMDRGRLEMEVALFAKNSDITEELTRLDNHMQNFTRTLKKRGEVGKKLDFISQELHREINTIGSKSSGFNISKGAIEIKTDIEKIREQLKNIE